MSKSTFVSTYLIHVLLCGFFLCMPLIIGPPLRPDEGFLQSFAFKKIATNASLIAYFYINYFFILRFLFARKYFIFGLLTAICFGIAFIPGYLITIGRRFPGPGFGPDFEITAFLFIALFFIAYSMRMNLRLKDMETEKLSAQFSMLKAQVSPHFLFNTLNSIYALAIKGAPDAASAIVKLANMLRYTLTESEEDFVPLEEEIRFTENYIALQKYRLGKTCIVEHTCKGDTGQNRIIPMVLIPYIENAFKYGVSEKEIATINISIKMSGQMLFLNVANRKMSEIPREHSTGLGLKNTKSRLELFYPDAHTFEIEENDVLYAVSLKLKLI